MHFQVTAWDLINVTWEGGHLQTMILTCHVPFSNVVHNFHFQLFLVMYTVMLEFNCGWPNGANHARALAHSFIAYVDL